MSDPTPPVQGRRAARRAAQEAAREARQAETLGRLRKYGVPALIVLVVLVLVVGVVKVVRGGGSSSDGTDTKARSQQTLLIQLVPSIGRATVGNALTASDSKSGDATFLALPGRLITDVPGRGRTTLDQTSVTADGVIAGQAIADQLGVLVDGSWVLTKPALASLINKVGGVTVDVDADVVVTRPGGAKVVVVPKGTAQKLDGGKAVAYATYLAPGETEQARLARFTEVWSALLRALPGDEAAVRNLVVADAGSVSSLAPDRLAAYLVALHDAVVSDSVAYPTLPTVVVDTGVGTPSYRLDSAKVPALVKTAFAGSLPPTPPGGRTTVLVQNGVGTPGLSEKARTKLIAAGLTYQGGGNAARFGYPTSVVLIPDSSLQARQQGAAVAAALGLPASAVKQSAQAQSVADVLVILGQDFRG